MTLLDALAAALRDRLLAGHAASLPGVGTLQRERVTARVEPQPDGSSLLLPPSETVAFVPGKGSEDAALATALLKTLGTPNADAASTLRQATDQLEGTLAASGVVQLPGVGVLRRTEAGAAFDADSGLLDAVARPYEGMGPVSTQASDVPPTDASFIDEETLDEDLDDVLAVPFETSDPQGLRAILPTTPDANDPSTPDTPPDSDTADPEDEPAGETLAAASLVPPADETNVWPTPAREEVPPVTSSETLPADLTPENLETPLAADMPDPKSPALGWLEEFDQEEEARADEVADGTLVGLASVAATAPVEGSATPHPEPLPPETPPHLPKPPPVIAGRVEPTPAKRGVPVWLWMLVPLLVLASLFFWYRTTQDPTPDEPVLTAELAPDDNLARVALDTLTAETATADSAELAAESGSLTDTTASPMLPDAAALEGEFPVEELSGGSGTPSARSAPPASSTSTTAPAARPAPAPPPRPAPSTSAAEDVAIDEPRLFGLSGADREALTGTTPIVSGRGGFSWVVLSTRDRTPADMRARQYREAGWRVRVFQTEALGDTVYRVAIGQFSSRDEAERLREFLPSQVPTDTWLLDLSTL